MATYTDDELKAIHEAAKARAAVNLPARADFSQVASVLSEPDPDAKRRDDETRELLRLQRRAAWRERIPTEYARWTLADYSEALQQHAGSFLSDDRWCMYLHGGVGSRKTSYACAVMRAWYDSGRSFPRLVPAYKAAAELRSMQRMEQAVHDWREAQMLCLDDIGSNRATPHVVEQLLLLLQHRYDWQRKTIITSNLSLNDLRQYIDGPDPRAASRISKGVILNLGDKDWRRQDG